MPQDQNRESRQSKELEALLMKLNGGYRSSVESVREDSLPSMPAFDDGVEEDYDEEDISLDSLTSMEDIEENVDADFADDSFFIQGEDEEAEHDSGPVPMGSGTFARSQSGGFHNLVETVKERADGAIVFLKERASAVKERFAGQNKEEKPRRRTQQKNTKEHPIKRILLAGSLICLILCIVIGIATYSNDNADHNDVAVAAQTQEAALTAEADDSRGDVVEETMPVAMVFENTDVVEPVVEEVQAVKPEVVAPKPAPGESTEAKLFGSKDNVLASEVAGETVKLKRTCVMREGPASRFGLVRNLGTGMKVSILTTSQEDWELKETNGKYAWFKNGEPMPKLGPGTQFRTAWPGQHVPKPSSRVISSSNWKYIKAGDVYGWVGPACFK